VVPYYNPWCDQFLIDQFSEELTTASSDALKQHWYYGRHYYLYTTWFNNCSQMHAVDIKAKEKGQRSRALRCHKLLLKQKDNGHQFDSKEVCFCLVK
jgi:hypothetical protein